MIDSAIDHIVGELKAYVDSSQFSVYLGNIHTLVDQNRKSGIYVSIVNLEEETVLRNTSHVVRYPNSIRYQEPPIFVNLYLLFASDFSDYISSLKWLTEIIEFFQHRRVFTANSASSANSSPFPDALEKLVFDYINLDFEQLNHLWSILGGRYLPSALYRVRLIKVQHYESLAGPEIDTIQVETQLR